MYQIVKNDDSGVRLDRWLKENLQDITYVEIQKLIRTGQVRVDGGRKKQNYRVNSGEKVRFPPKFTKMNIDINKNMPKNTAFSLEEIKIYEDDSLIVINKPYGLSTQGGTKVKYHIDGLLSIENENDKNNYRLIHRLDKYTSGALIVAKKRESASFYTKKFFRKEIKKTYLVDNYIDSVDLKNVITIDNGIKYSITKKGNDIFPENNNILSFNYVLLNSCYLWDSDS